MPPRTGSRIIERLVDKTAQLYSLPNAVVTLLQKMEDPSCDLEELRSILATDPALAVKVLRIVNSAFFGLPTRVADLGQALALLGRSKLRLIVLGFTLPEHLFAGVEKRLLSRFWRRSARKSVAAREVATLVAPRITEEAFLVALVEDIGLLCLMRELGPPFCRLVQVVWEVRANLLTMESEVLGFNHRELSAALLTRWCFPQRIVQLIRLRAGMWANEPDVTINTNDPSGMCPAILALAESLSEETFSDLAPSPHGAEDSQQRDELSSKSQPTSIIRGLASFCQLRPEQIEEIRSKLEVKMRDLAELLNVELLPLEQLTAVVQRSRELLAEAAAQAAESLLQLEAGWTHFRPKGQPQTKKPVTASSIFPRESTASISGFESKGMVRERDNGEGARPAHAKEGPSPMSGPNSPPHRSRALYDPGLLAFVKAGIATCRARHSPISLLLFELGAMEELLPILGIADIEKLRDNLEFLPAAVHIPAEWVRPYDEWGLAILLPEHDRWAAKEVANQLDRWWRKNCVINVSGLPLRTTAAIGVATAAIPSRTLQPEELLERAERCLFGSRECGGLVKSIDL